MLIPALKDAGATDIIELPIVEDRPLTWRPSGDRHGHRVRRAPRARRGHAATTARAYPFHCTAIADGTRTIAVGTAVTFDVVPGRLGRWEASGLRPD